MYTDEELQRFEAELRDKEEELKRRAETLRQEQELLNERGKALEAQRREYQQVRVPPEKGSPEIIMGSQSNYVKSPNTFIIVKTLPVQMLISVFLNIYQAVLEMSQRQKEAPADGQPPAGLNGELPFRPETRKSEDKGKQTEIRYVLHC